MTVQIRPTGTDGWLAFVSGERLLMVDRSDDAFVAAAWTALAAEEGIEAVLELLISSGLAAAPSFALLEWERPDVARAILRGGVVLSVSDSRGEQRIAPEGVSTWVERTLTSVSSLTIEVPVESARDDLSLPLISGVAFAAGVSVHPTTGERPPRPSATETPVPLEPESDPAATVRDVPAAVDSEQVAATTTATTTSETTGEGYDYLFGDTMYRSVTDAAVHGPPDDDAPVSGDVPAAAVDTTLHDGETIMSSDVSALKNRRRSSSAPVAPVIDEKAHTRPPRLVIALSTTGLREALDQTVIIGRNPTASEVSSGTVPKLLTIDAPDQDISRSHVQIAVEGGTVVVTDLHSRNGTMIELPGKSPQKLRAGEPTAVIVGAVIDLGSDIRLTVEEDG